MSMVLQCTECEDITQIQDEPRWCKCTRSSGVNMGGDKIAITGPCRVFECEADELQIAGIPLQVDDKRVKRGRFSAPRLPKYPSYIPDEETE